MYKNIVDFVMYKTHKVFCVMLRLLVFLSLVIHLQAVIFAQEEDVTTKQELNVTTTDDASEEGRQKNDDERKVEDETETTATETTKNENEKPTESEAEEKENDSNEKQKNGKTKPAEKELTADEKSIVQSIKVSTDRDLVLWLNGLGLGINGGRSEHERALITYYKLPSDVLVEKSKDSKDTEKNSDEESKKKNEAEAKKSDVKKDEEESKKVDEKKDDEESKKVDDTKSEDDGEVKSEEDETEKSEKNEEEKDDDSDDKSAKSDEKKDDEESKKEKEKKKLITSEVTKPIAEGETTSITITNADNARYFTYEKIDEHVFVLKGNVEIIVEQRNKKRLHRITSNKLVYNETLRVGSAVGNVTYSMYAYDKEPPKTYSEKATEEFTGSVVSFSIDEFNSDVVHGIAYTESEVKYGAKQDKKETLAFKIFAPHISKSPEDVITISNASLTSSKLTPPLYRIRLRKMWVLNSSGEWAISRATVFLGDIPVLWFPFFVNPGDKFFFHPAIGYKMRAGGYINTTTYLIGKHKTKDGEGNFLDIFNISNSKKDTRKIIKGLYLREPEAGDLVRTYPPKWELKYLLDYYTTVGLYSALEGKFPKIWKFDKLSFSAGLGFSHTVYNIKDSYFNNHINKHGKLAWNLDHGYIYNTKVPIRYNFKLDTKLNFGSPYSTSLLFEQYSDSFIKRDFFQRVFDFDWEQLFDPNKDIKDFNKRESQISSYYWRWNNTIKIPTNKLVGNYIESIAINDLRLQMDWKRKNIDEKLYPRAYKKEGRIAGSSIDQKIEGSFFYPNQIEIPTYRTVISGTLFSLDSTKLDFRNGLEKTIFVEAQKKREEEKKKKKDTLSKDKESTEKESKNTEDKGEEDAEKEDTSVTSTDNETEETKEDKIETQKDLAEYVPLSISKKAVSKEAANTEAHNDMENKGLYDVIYPKEKITAPAAYDFDWKKTTLLYTYKINHSLAEKLYLNDKKWKRPEDIPFLEDYLVEYGQLTTDNTFTLTQKFTTFDSLLSYTWDISLSIKRRFLNNADELSAKDKDTKEKSAKKYTKEDLSNIHTVTLSPLKMFSVFSDTKISYVSNFYIGKNLFETKEAAKFYEHDDKKWWKNHTFKQRYVAKYAHTTNTLGLDIELPPRLEAYTPLYNFSLDTYLKLSLQTKIFKKKDKKDTWFYDPLKFSGSLSFFEKELQFTQTLNYNYEHSHMKDMKTSLKLWWFSFDFLAEREKRYVFNVEQFSFKKVGKEELRPSTITTDFTYKVSNIWFWRDRINFLINFSTKYSHAFLNFTKTKLTLSSKFDFIIHQILKLTFSIDIQNDLMFLYYTNYAEQVGVPVRNFWQDTIDGFNVFDTKALERTPFKLGKLSLGITQDFGGWVLDVVYSGSSKRKSDRGIVKYEWQNTLEFGVYWKPIPNIKTSVYYRKDALSLDEEIKKK